MTPERIYLPHKHGIYDVLVANDKIRTDEPDAWKYKIVAPYSTWSLDFPSRDLAVEAARDDIRDNG